MPSTTQSRAISDLFSVIAPYGEFILTKKGSLIAGVELSGIDPDGLTSINHQALSEMARMIYGRLDARIMVTQYYAHFGGVIANLRGRDHPIADKLSRSRVEYLNRKSLNSSRLVHYLEIEPSQRLNRLSFVELFKHIFAAIHSASSRGVLKNAVSSEHNLLLCKQELDAQYDILKHAVDAMNTSWSMKDGMTLYPMTAGQTWAHMRFLASFRAPLLQIGKDDALPLEDWDYYLTEGELSPVVVNGLDAMKIGGPVNKYVRFAAIKRIGAPKIKPGFWANGADSPFFIKGNYVLMARWKPLTKVHKSLLFQKTESELNRQSINIGSLLLSHHDKLTEKEKREMLTPAIRDKLDELGEAESIDERWGNLTAMIAVFGEDAEQIRRTSIELDRATSSNNISMLWETVGTRYAYQAFQPGGSDQSIREMKVSLSQFCAAALFYQSSIGQPSLRAVGQAKDEEALYLLETPDGQLFHYSPFCGGKGLVITLGPTRSGKTYLKNTFASHLMKYDGLYRAIDIDPGSEPIAMLYGKGKGIFRVGDHGYGFNPFVNYRGQDDRQFRAYFTKLILYMMRANDEAGLKQLDSGEQQDVDRAVSEVLRLAEQDRSFPAFVALLPAHIRAKLARWVHPGKGMAPGQYSGLFDHNHDAIGRFDEMVGVYNLQAMKNDQAIAAVLWELFYRTTQTFEHPDYRHYVKGLDIDEAHYALNIPGFAEYIHTGIRTWNKYQVVLQLLIQSPLELANSIGWPVIKSSVSTLIFMADPNLEADLYCTTFGISLGDCEVIRGLVPQREAYIIQRDLGIAKKVIVDTELEQYAVNTSHPQETSIRNQLIEQYGFETGMNKFISYLRDNGSNDADYLPQREVFH